MYGFYVVASYRCEVLLLLALAEFMHCKHCEMYTRYLLGRLGQSQGPQGITAIGMVNHYNLVSAARLDRYAIPCSAQYYRYKAIMF